MIATWQSALARDRPKRSTFVSYLINYIKISKISPSIIHTTRTYETDLLLSTLNDRFVIYMRCRRSWSTWSLKYKAGGKKFTHFDDCLVVSMTCDFMRSIVSVSCLQFYRLSLDRQSSVVLSNAEGAHSKLVVVVVDLSGHGWIGGATAKRSKRIILSIEC